MTEDERIELEFLRRSAAIFINDPLERAFLELERTIERANSTKTDAILPSNAFHVLARAVMELKRSIVNGKP